MNPISHKFGKISLTVLSVLLIASLYPAYAVSAATDQDWPVHLVKGTNDYQLGQAEFESIAAVHPASWQSNSNLYNGTALWRLVAIADGGDTSAIDTTLLASNYTVKLTQFNDGYDTFAGITVAGNDDLIIANKMDGNYLALTDGVSGKPQYPVKIVGAESHNGLRLGGLTSIELVYAVRKAFDVGLGSITSNTTFAPVGGSQTFNIAPAFGYRILNVLVNGASVGAVSTYTFNNVSNGDQTIVALFTSTSIPAWDLNGDHSCNIADVVRVGLVWGQTGAHAWIPEDLNSDGVINIGDVVVLGLNWGQTW